MTQFSLVNINASVNINSLISAFISILTSSSQNIINNVNHWLEAAVIGLGLCPFAKPVWQQQKIHFAVSVAKSDEALLMDLYDEFIRLDKNALIETTLLIIPDHLNDFAAFNEFQTLAESLLDQYNWTGILQIASFHPQYQFADTSPDDRENSTNRSPYPILHLLREHSLSQAIASHPAPETIPTANIERLNSLDNATFERIFSVKPSVLK